METAARYRHFAEREARGESPCYEEWATSVATDPEVLALLADLPPPKRQPNLLFAAARHTGVPPGPYKDFRTALLSNWPTVRKVMLTKSTQTNEPGRCAVLLPLLAALPQPLALLEVGASAGLCLYPDRYSYRYDNRPRLDPPDGPSKVVLDCTTTGPVPFPTRVPDVAWRAGIDLNPLTPADADWLTALIWPEHDHRRTRLTNALALTDATPVIKGDLIDQLPSLAAQAPPDATLVIFHSAVLPYLTDESRTEFTDLVRTMNTHWISNEGTRGHSLFTLSLNGRPVAHAAGHGHTLHWLPE